MNKNIFFAIFEIDYEKVDTFNVIIENLVLKSFNPDEVVYLIVMIRRKLPDK